MKTELTQNELLVKFHSLHKELDRWGSFIDDILNKEADSLLPDIKENIQFRAQHRIKDDASFISKALYRKKNYTDPLKDITDKVGTRMVFLFPDSVECLSKFIESCDKWVAQKAKDITKIKYEQPDVFTYQSNHFIVKPTNDYSTQVDKDLLTCEIQVRTLLQHAYSEVSHSLFYKQDKNIDNRELRMLAASMAFLEESDLKFQNILDMNVSPNNMHYRLYCQLVKDYHELNSTFEVQKNDRESVELYFEILGEEKIKQVSKELSDFLLDRYDDLKQGIIDYKDDCFLFGQPLLILVAFSFSTWQNFTIKNWPFGYESLKNVLQMLGYSDDVL